MGGGGLFIGFAKLTRGSSVDRGTK